jgi:hypothetical protein
LGTILLIFQNCKLLFWKILTIKISRRDHPFRQSEKAYQGVRAKCVKRDLLANRSLRFGQAW